MKALILSVALLMCSCMPHVQQDRLSTFFATPKTYHDIVMELGPHSHVVDTGYTRIFVWHGGQHKIGVAHVAGVVGSVFGVAVSKESGWRLTVSFGKASGQITDWKFRTY